MNEATEMNSSPVSRTRKKQNKDVILPFVESNQVILRNMYRLHRQGSLIPILPQIVAFEKPELIKVRMKRNKHMDLKRIFKINQLIKFVTSKEFSLTDWKVNCF